jgi:2-polyprenyl-3-methyl-5-hydroxy-6-metoxy-1,4-benzoquinol methylase
MHNQEFLNSYFAESWKPSEDAYTYSAYSTLAKKVMPNQWVLDVGCGGNPFKKLLPNVIGIDPARDEADYKVTIEEFETEQQFDVAMCLGSINFGTREDIEPAVDKVVSLLKPQSQIFWRLNPGRNDHACGDCEQIKFFPWSHDILAELALKHGYVQSNQQEETNGRVIRLYAEWHRTEI